MVIRVCIGCLSMAALSGCAQLPVEPNTARDRKGAFDTREAYDSMMQAQGRKCLDAQDNSYLAWGESYVMKSFVSRNTPGKKPVQSMEDFSHGSIEIGFAYRCWRDTIVFTREDIERLANTFQKNIVRRTDDGKLTFANRVDGLGGVGRYDRLGPSWPLLAKVRPGILDSFREVRSDSPWNGYSPWLLQSANMNLVRAGLAAGDTHAK